MFLQILAVLGAISGFVFITLSIASGLYYLSELVEEYSEPTRRLLSRAIYSLVGVYILLWIFDGFPFMLTCFSIGSYVVYYQNLRRFPFVSLTSPTFVCSCVLVFMNHYFWLRYFNNTDISLQSRVDPNYVPKRRATFVEVTSFFGICIWFIPFALFVSLSAGDNMLPMTMGKKDDDSAVGRRASSLLKVAIDAVREYFQSVARLLGIRGLRQQDGLVL
ncbi:Svp26p Ecym_5106 [Eremothecium cymbalariae DBVPG|uniref:Protein SVP26 n=1 Tax=Eremothecium cymbalariae (strain CBS 270.75 / DBVPG 7215 / KCTC 17166 / NRRL Y-17582) TaxID=931890 RepID=I6NCU6_ERECY|nr:hypothetical protein Ecym_5106 [Eremothecium cymbalariae DBVPG\